MRIAQVSPTYFDEGSFIGGGERYVNELAKALKVHAEIFMISFGEKRESFVRDEVHYEIYAAQRIRGNPLNPFSLLFIKSTLRMDVIHVHQVNTLSSDLCALHALVGKKVFVTDHGGGAGEILNTKLLIYSLYCSAVAQSQFAGRLFRNSLQHKISHIPGGIDLERFFPDDTPKKNNILYVGRVLPHKGIDVLVRAFSKIKNAGLRLRIVGHVKDDDYVDHLKKLAVGFDVDFIGSVDDQELIQEYRSARVTVLPTVEADYLGRKASACELMGFTLLESQACGTPVICSNNGAMPEFVDEGATGRICEMGAVDQLNDALRWIFGMSDEQYHQCSQACVSSMQKYSWKTVAQKHMELYTISKC